MPIRLNRCFSGLSKTMELKIVIVCSESDFFVEKIELCLGTFLSVLTFQAGRRVESDRKNRFYG